VSLAFLSGCAGVNVFDVSDSQADAQADGFRYYEKATFLIITADGRGGVDAKVHQICDTTRKRAVDPYAVMANNNMVLDLDYGCLAGEQVTIDETVVPKAMISAIKTAATTAAGFLFDAASAGSGEAARVGTYPGPVIYRLTVENGSVVLRGAAAPQDIRVTITQPAEQGVAK
jgi:hypothetical protein